ncbi:hypothetical protein QBC36DRAFT_362104 [Triangularia setosa]|uniref:Uncharacterized protein n=1 Tax=Triangularia setosa TaxID=2587417 RepID=A0AAN6WCQ4_9PEZI|nr:hypothetical protein QBC36DRAFT_362104 [Podospora setosa]
MDRHVESIIRLDLQLLEEPVKKNHTGHEVEIWGEISPDRWYIQLYYGRVLHDSTESVADGCSGPAIHLLDQTNLLIDPAPAGIITTDLKHRTGLRAQRQLFAVIGNRIPTYSTQEEASPPTHGQRKQQLFGHWSTTYALFRQFRGFGASDPRDKVYALLEQAKKVDCTLDPLPVVAYNPGIIFLLLFGTFWTSK